MTTGKDEILVSCENLVRIYKIADLEVFALQGLDLLVRRGEMLGIVGNSGSGKTTLMNILGGLDRPSAGKVTVDGVDLLGLSDTGLTGYQRSKVGFVWQQTARNLIPYLTAQENVELPMTLAWASRQKKTWAAELLNTVGLYERREHKLVQLSGGEQQRVAIAVALANRPVLLLGDEPTGEVDSATAQAIMDTFRQMATLFDLTVIIVTHDPRIARIVDRVVAIRDGKISTETIRKVNQEAVEAPSAAHASGPQAAAEPAPVRDTVTYHEYVVLDSAGRLQVPHDWLEQLKIKKRALLDMDGNSIRILPAEDQSQSAEQQPQSFEDQLAGLFAEEPPPSRARKSLFSRLRLPAFLARRPGGFS